MRLNAGPGNQLSLLFMQWAKTEMEKNLSQWMSLNSFVRVDGPKLTDDCFINVDLIIILKTADKSVFARIDGRRATVAMCRALFGDRVVVTKPRRKHSGVCEAAQEDIYKENRLIVKVLVKMLMGSYLDIPR